MGPVAAASGAVLTATARRGCLNVHDHVFGLIDAGPRRCDLMPRLGPEGETAGAGELPTRAPEPTRPIACFSMDRALASDYRRSVLTSRPSYKPTRSEPSPCSRQDTWHASGTINCAISSRFDRRVLRLARATTPPFGNPRRLVLFRLVKLYASTYGMLRRHAE